jgi:hypothetical protein
MTAERKFRHILEWKSSLLLSVKIYNFEINFEIITWFRPITWKTLPLLVYKRYIRAMCNWTEQRTARGKRRNRASWSGSCRGAELAGPCCSCLELCTEKRLIVIVLHWVCQDELNTILSIFLLQVQNYNSKLRINLFYVAYCDQG